MKLIKMDCPYCGGELHVREQDTVMTCPYCSRTVVLDSEVQKQETVINIRDEAKLKEAELNDRRYQEEQRRIKEQKIEQFRKGKAGKFMIAFMVICALAMMSAFMGHKILAGLIGIVQLVLLAAAWLIATDHIQTIRGFRIPPFILTMLACVLVIPFLMLFNARTYETYVWPETELTARLPKPQSPYGTVSVSTSESLSLTVDKTSTEDYASYLSLCRQTFQNDVTERTGFEGYDDDGYLLKLSYDAGEKQMKIHAEAPEELEDISWPVSELASILPEPPSAEGVIESNRADYLNVRFGDMRKEDVKRYVDAVMEAGFTENYVRDDTSFTAENAEGYLVLITAEPRSQMTLELHAPAEETPQPEAPEPTLEPTPEPERSEPAAEPEPESTPAPAAAGIRPEFRKTMEDYEAFYDEYIAFMQKYQNSDNSLSMMSDYMSLLNRMSEWESSMDKIDESELSDEELMLFNDVNLRVASKLNHAALTMN